VSPSPEVPWGGTDGDFSSKNQISASDKSRVSALDATIETATGELEDIRERAKAIEAEIKALEKKILDIGGARLLTQKSKVDGLKLHINLANDEITKAEVAKAKAEKDVVKLAKSIQTNKDALSEAEADLGELDLEMTQCTQAVEEFKDKVNGAKNQEENSKTVLDEVKSELDDMSEKIRGFKKKEVSAYVGHGDMLNRLFPSSPSPRSSISLKQKRRITRSVSITGPASTRNSSSSILSKSSPLSTSMCNPDPQCDSDDEEDDEGGEPGDEEEEEEEQAKKEGEVKSEVKAEPGTNKKNSRDANELRIYHEDELGLLKPDQLLADVQLLDGACAAVPYSAR